MSRCLVNGKTPDAPWRSPPGGVDARARCGSDAEDDPAHLAQPREEQEGFHH